MRKSLAKILCMSFWAAVAAKAAVMHDQEDGEKLTDILDTSETDSHLYVVKLPLPPNSLKATPLSPSTVRLQWTSGLLTPPALSFAIERSQKLPRRSRVQETVEDDVKYYVNTTICVRERRKDTKHLLVLESEPSCLSNVHGLLPKIVKPLYVAFVELIALSLFVSAISCIFVHFALEHIKTFLKNPDQHASMADCPYDRHLKTWLREYEDDKEPEERSCIQSVNRATSV